MILYQCEDTLESIFTAIYSAYEEHRDHNDTVIALHRDLMLFAEYIPVAADNEKAEKVIRTLQRKFGEEDYRSICYALSAPDPEKAQAVYRTIVKGLKAPVRAGHLLDNLADDDCNKVFSLARAAGRECHHLMGFVRFREVQSGILYSVIGPKAHILTFLMPHFADRLPQENFIIYDEKRELFGIHPAGKDWYLMKGPMEHIREGILEESDTEKEQQELFRYFCRKIAIKERENKELQRNMLPLRYREYMVEFGQGERKRN